MKLTDYMRLKALQIQYEKGFGMTPVARASMRVNAEPNSVVMAGANFKQNDSAMKTTFDSIPTGGYLRSLRWTPSVGQDWGIIK